MKLTASNFIISSCFMYHTLAQPSKIHTVPKDVTNPQRIKYFKYLGDPASTGGSQYSSYNCDSKLKCTWEIDETWKESEWDWDSYSWIDHFVAKCQTKYQCQNWKSDCSQQTTSCTTTGESQISALQEEEEQEEIPAPRIPESKLQFKKPAEPSEINSQESARLNQNNFESLNPTDDEFGGDDEFIGGDDSDTADFAPSTHSVVEDNYSEWLNLNGEEDEAQQEQEPQQQQAKPQNEPKSEMKYDADSAALKQFYQENYYRTSWNQAYSCVTWNYQQCTWTTNESWRQTDNRTGATKDFNCVTTKFCKFYESVCQPEKVSCSAGAN